MDKVSVIVPIYNGEKQIEKCAKSILEQSYRNIELIFVNDGSTDRSLGVCAEIAKMDNRVKVLSQDNHGVSSARNKGLCNATGEYFVFVDVDDCLLPEMLSTVIDCAEHNAADVVVYGWTRYYAEDDTYENIKEEFEVIDNTQFAIKRILQNYSACGGGYPWNKIWRRSSISEIQLFDEDLFYFEDLEWVVRMLLQVNKIAICPECLYQYTVHAGSVTNNPSRAEAKEISYHKAINKVIDSLGEVAGLQQWLKEKYAPEIVNGIVHARRKGWTGLEKFLKEQLQDVKQLIMNAGSIPFKTKIRCLGLLFCK